MSKTQICILLSEKTVERMRREVRNASVQDCLHLVRIVIFIKQDKHQITYKVPTSINLFIFYLPYKLYEEGLAYVTLMCPVFGTPNYFSTNGQLFLKLCFRITPLLKLLIYIYI